MPGLHHQGQCRWNRPIDKYKARLIAQGLSQTPEVDCDQTFFPTVRLSGLHVVVTQTCLEGKFLESVNISNAYLNSKMPDKSQVFMHQAEGYEVVGTKSRKMVCFLNKDNYGLKQEGCLWSQKLAAEL
jgi:hypothetical protein